MSQGLGAPRPGSQGKFPRGKGHLKEEQVFAREIWEAGIPGEDCVGKWRPSSEVMACSEHGDEGRETRVSLGWQRWDGGWAGSDSKWLCGAGLYPTGNGSQATFIKQGGNMNHCFLDSGSMLLIGSPLPAIVGLWYNIRTLGWGSFSYGGMVFFGGGGLLSPYFQTHQKYVSSCEWRFK